MPRYHLRTLLIVLALGPPLMALAWLAFSNRGVFEIVAPIATVVVWLGIANVAIFLLFASLIWSVASVSRLLTRRER